MGQIGGLKVTVHLPATRACVTHCWMHAHITLDVVINMGTSLFHISDITIQDIYSLDDHIELRKYVFS